MVTPRSFGEGTNGSSAKMLYENNFEKTELDKLPAELLVIDGQFSVKEENGNKFLELPGAPLDTFGAMFGPAENEDVCAAAKIFATSKGRRFPVFGLGIGGAGGYKIQVSPAKKSLELLKGDSALKTIPYEWKSGEWTELHMQVRKVSEGSFKIEGKAWAKGGTEPKGWSLAIAETNAPPKGRASVWGSPYSGTAIRFDDLSLEKTADK